MIKPLVVLAVAALLGATQNAHACKDSVAFAPDKQKHFAVSVALGAGARLVADDTTAAFLIGLTPGVIKELQDMRGPTHHCASYVDLAYDALGVAIGVSSTNWVIRHNFIGYKAVF